MFITSHILTKYLHQRLLQLNKILHIAKTCSGQKYCTVLAPYHIKVCALESFLQSPCLSKKVHINQSWSPLIVAHTWAAMIYWNIQKCSGKRQKSLTSRSCPRQTRSFYLNFKKHSIYEFWCAHECECFTSSPFFLLQILSRTFFKLKKKSNPSREFQVFLFPACLFLLPSKVLPSPRSGEA